MAGEAYFSQVDIRLGNGRITIGGRTYDLADVGPVRIDKVPAAEPRERWWVIGLYFAIAILVYLLFRDTLPAWIASILGLGVAILYGFSARRFKDMHDFVLTLDTPDGPLHTRALTKTGYLLVVIETIDKARKQQIPEIK